jgi:hypothetical protein
MPPTREICVFQHVMVVIKAILHGACSKYPLLTVAELMAGHEPPLQEYAQVKLGPSGSCLDFLWFGVYKHVCCSYKHMATAVVQVA